MSLLGARAICVRDADARQASLPEPAAKRAKVAGLLRRHHCFRGAPEDSGLAAKESPRNRQR